MNENRREGRPRIVPQEDEGPKVIYRIEDRDVKQVGDLIGYFIENHERAHGAEHSDRYFEGFMTDLEKYVNETYVNPTPKVIRVIRHREE